MFTLEIGGRAIAVIGTDEEDARDLVANPSFREDLQRLLSDDQPLWDGQAELVLRPANEEEIAEFDESEDEPDSAEEEDEDEDEEEGAVVLFLVPILDPDEEDEDEA
ncbi:hypothetical protein [Pseudoroseomonas cervicalis]|uniref:hypothetical protein n=1 Tax=Teichococcus cervicalis TaxID=204525 RepID=UPI0022F18B13|nr:hypothetical protein [Pseudoroseomonas cervicalis]WBV45089.1 hypothetical protein PFY06_19815 [Pseudoroseomonas cervicalis]